MSRPRLSVYHGETRKAMGLKDRRYRAKKRKPVAGDLRGCLGIKEDGSYCTNRFKPKGKYQRLCEQCRYENEFKFDYSSYAAIVGE